MIGSIENAIIARIEEVNASGALGYNLRQIKTYGGEAKDSKARARIKDFPAVWLHFDGTGTSDQHLTTSDRFPARFALLVGTQNLRNEKAARHGGHGAVGAYQIICDLAGMLAGTCPGDLAGVGKIGNMQIQPLSVEESGNGRIAVYALTFTVTFQNQRINPGVDLDNPLEVIHTNWDLPPTGEVGPDLPDDENANATSHVTGD